MADLITKLRGMIGDTAGTPVFTDNQLQDFLDAHRLNVTRYPLHSEGEIAEGGAKSFLTYRSEGMEFWEDDVLVQSNTYATLTPDSDNLVVGEWTFSASQAGPVYATGKTYDLHSAAYDALTDWASKVKLDFDFSDADTSVSRSQKFTMLTDLAEYHRARMKHRSVSLERTDWR